MHLLSDGLSQLCQNDSGLDQLVSPRRETILALLEKYLVEIERFNPALSLVGTNDRQELIVRHILDSLAPLGSMLKVGKLSKIADVGSGAGLPGIPLAIALPHAECTLIERKGRRAGFLRNTVQALGLSNVVIEEQEMEKAQRGRFALVTFRAFKPLEPKIYKKLSRLCTGGGVLAAYKGRREKIETEIAALEKAFPGIGHLLEIIPCPVPFLDEERHLLVIREAA